MTGRLVTRPGVPFIIRSAVRLLDLLDQCPEVALVQGDPSTDVRSVVQDSRRVQPGALFVVREPRHKLHVRG